jgi:hypothetical protein
MGPPGQGRGQSNNHSERDGVSDETRRRRQASPKEISGSVQNIGRTHGRPGGFEQETSAEAINGTSSARHKARFGA